MGSKGLGLLARMHDLEMQLARLREEAEGVFNLPGRQARVKDYPGQEELKDWQRPCHFACVPFGFDPVDVYGTETITAEGGGD